MGGGELCELTRWMWRRLAKARTNQCGQLGAQRCQDAFAVFAGNVTLSVSLAVLMELRHKCFHDVARLHLRGTGHNTVHGDRPLQSALKSLRPSQFTIHSAEQSPHARKADPFDVI